MEIAVANPPRAWRNFAFNGARILASAATGLAISIITARALGPQAMGVYSFLIWIAGTMASLASLGLSSTISKYIAEYLGQKRPAMAAKAARAIVMLQIAVAVAVTILAICIWPLFAHRQLPLILWALSVVIPSALQQTLLGLMEGKQRFDLQAVATLAGALLQIALVIYFALRKATIVGFLAANLLSTIAIVGLLFVLCRPALALPSALEEPAPDFNFAKKLFSFSLSVYGLWFLSLIVFDKSEMFFLRAFRAPEELAFYSIAFALGARLATVGDSISEVLFPMFVTRYAQSGAAGLRGLCNRSLRYYCLFILPLYLWCVPLTPRLLNFFYGERYAAVAPVFQIMLITLLFSALLPIGSSALFALDKQFSFLRYLVLVAAINLIFDFLLIPRYGAVGAALANGAAQALAACAQARVLHKALPGGFPFVVLLKIYLAGTVSVIPLVYCARMPHASFLLLSASAVLALLLYIALLVALRAIQFDQLAVAKTNLHSFVSRKA